MKFLKEFTEKKAVKIALLCYTAIFPFLLFFALEGLNPASTELLALSFSSLGVILMSAFFIFAVAMIIYVLSGSVFWSYLPVSAVLGVAYVVNNLKLAIAGNVFVPTDLMIATEALIVTDISTITIERVLLARIFLVVILHLPLFFVKFKPKLRNRAIMFGGAIAAFLIFFVSGFYASAVVPALRIDTTGPINTMYRNTGLIVGFHAAFADHIARNMNAADAAYIAQAFFGEPAPAASDGLRPNVIVVMSEAFMDPTIIYNLEFSTDPASNFRRLSRQHISGMTMVPVFGGGTANTELEFLTGSPLFFKGSSLYVPYSNTDRYFFRDITTAMPYLFRENGYRTVAVHPFTRYFFSRNLVYPRLGFDYLIFYEDMEDPVYKGYFVSDEFFTDQIIEQIILAEDAGEPLFLFGISMQNHWEFWEDKYLGFDQDVYAVSPYLNDVETGRLNAYLQGIYDADKQLGRLIEFIEGRETPTIVVFFGDHMPIIGAHTDAIFETLGYISIQERWQWNMEDRRKMFEMPYLVWSNFAPADEEWGTLSTYFLGAQVLRHSGIDLNAYWHHILYAGEHFRVLTENHYVDIQGNFHPAYTARGLPHISAMDALIQVKWFGTDDFHNSLSNIVSNR